jgi:hypothetical protein
MRFFQDIFIPPPPLGVINVLSLTFFKERRNVVIMLLLCDIVKIYAPKGVYVYTRRASPVDT